MSKGGSIQVSSLPPGTYDIELSLRLPPTYIEQRVILDGPWEVQAGQKRSVELDISHLVPVNLTGEAMLNGRPLAEGEFILRRCQPAASRREKPRGMRTRLVDLKLKTDAQGAFSMENAVPGEYEAVLRVARSGPVREIVAVDKVVLLPGESRHVLFVFTKTRARIRILSADGKQALVNRRVSWRVKGIFFYQPFKDPTDDQGLLDIPVLPAGELEFQLMPVPGKSNSVPLGMLIVPVGQADFTAELRAPAEEGK